MSSVNVERDERTLAVETAGYRWTYLVLSYGLLVITAYRGLVRHESSWDLLALVIIGGAFNAAYQGWHRVLYRRWIVMTIVTFVIAVLVAAGILIVRRAV
jgi:hypothetical protein